MTKNMGSIFIIILLAIISSVSYSFAQENRSVTEDFKYSARDILEDLIQAGYKKIGKLELDTILEKLNDINLNELDWVETPQENGKKRIFARWYRDREGVSISINKSVWNKSDPQFKGALALHEILGGFGYDDEDYSLSTALWLLRENSGRKVLKEGEVNYVLKCISEGSKSSSGGGVIGVGGGGDLMGPGLKISMLSNAFNEFSENPTEENRVNILKTFQITQMFSIEGSWKISP